MAAKNQRGFTLIELVIALTLVSIISVAMAKLLMQGYMTYITAKSVSESDWQAFLALNTLASDLREVRSPNDITSASTSALTFTTISGTSVQYQLSSTTLLRNTITLATGVESVSFSYLDASGAVTSTPSLIRYVVINLRLNRDYVDKTYTNTVFLRELTS